MKKLILTFLLCLVCAAMYAQPSKGNISISGDYQFSKEKNITASHMGYFGVDYFVSNKVSIGVGVGYEDYFRYAVQVNYYVPIKGSFYFSLNNNVSCGMENKEHKPRITIVPTFNYDVTSHWTIYGALASAEVGFNSTYCRANVNSPRIGFMYTF